MVELSTLIVTIVIGLIIFFVIKGKQEQKRKKKIAEKEAEKKLEFSSSSASQQTDNEGHKKFLNSQKQPVKLKEKIKLTHDTFLFRFALPEKDMVLGLPVGKHFKVYAPNPSERTEQGKWNGREDKEASRSEVTRSYTPTSSDDDIGFLDLVIKVYFAGKIDRFPDGGKVSQYLNSLKIGDELTISGPYGAITYEGNNKFTYARKPLVKKRIGMIAGGTGLTPMLQVIQHALKNKNDDTHFTLLYGNKSEDDILVRDTLENLRDSNPDRFELYYTLDNPPDQWKFYSGFVTSEMITETMPKPASDTLILLCGPPPMVNGLKKSLAELGYGKKDVLSF